MNNLEHERTINNILMGALEEIAGFGGSCKDPVGVAQKALEIVADMNILHEGDEQYD
tara:strand:- start:1457 stop:1627 length:171 start_codon:yes stop_codon:yes gene_type:complete